MDVMDKTTRISTAFFMEIKFNVTIKVITINLVIQEPTAYFEVTGRYTMN